MVWVSCMIGLDFLLMAEDPRISLKKQGFYHQKYCGCVFSQTPKV